MATIKSFTDISQSKKLAEILSIESADMTWCNSSIKGINYIGPWHVELKTPIEIESIFNKAVSDWKTWCSIIPCWSLAALYNLLPSVITMDEKRMFLTLEKAGAYNLYYKSPDRLDELWETKEDAIDACYEMILKLHEQKLL